MSPRLISTASRRSAFSSSSATPSWPRSACRFRRCSIRSAENALSPAGEFQTDAQRLPVRVTGAQQGAEAVAGTPIFAGGQTFRLGDVAKVSHGYEDPPSFLIRAQDEPALEVGVVMQKGGNILALGKALDATLADFEVELPRGVAISRIADQPQVVDKAVNEFTRSFIEALTIVLAVELPFARLAGRFRRRDLGSLVLATSSSRWRPGGLELAARDARRAHRRARPPGRRRHHRR